MSALNAPYHPWNPPASDEGAPVTTRKDTPIPPLIVVEPASGQSKRRAAEIILGKERQPQIESIKAHLKEIRQYARDHQVPLREMLTETLSRYGIPVAMARDAREAAAYVKNIAGGSHLLSLNKSNIVVNELRPELEKAGFATYLRYFHEFHNFEAGTFQKQVKDYWSLPGMHGRGLVESFEAQQTIGPLNT